MCMIIASVLSHLVVRTWRFSKINEKKYKRNINIDLAMWASQKSFGGAIHDSHILMKR